MSPIETIQNWKGGTQLLAEADHGDNRATTPRTPRELQTLDFDPQVRRWKRPENQKRRGAQTINHGQIDSGHAHHKETPAKNKAWTRTVNTTNSEEIIQSIQLND